VSHTLIAVAAVVAGLWVLWKVTVFGGETVLWLGEAVLCVRYWLRLKKQLSIR